VSELQGLPPAAVPADVAIVVETDDQRAVFEGVLRRLHARLS
jgi:hypothetical protein